MMMTKVILFCIISSYMQGILCAVVSYGQKGSSKASSQMRSSLGSSQTYHSDGNLVHSHNLCPNKAELFETQRKYDSTAQDTDDENKKTAKRKRKSHILNLFTRRDRLATRESTYHDRIIQDLKHYDSLERSRLRTTKQWNKLNKLENSHLNENSIKLRRNADFDIPVIDALSEKIVEVEESNKPVKLNDLSPKDVEGTVADTKEDAVEGILEHDILAVEKSVVTRPMTLLTDHCGETNNDDQNEDKWIPSIYEDSPIKKEFKSKHHLLGKTKRGSEPEALVWDHWGPWSQCSATCGRAKKVRWRHCISAGCAPGLKRAQIKRCHLPPC